MKFFVLYFVIYWTFAHTPWTNGHRPKGKVKGRSPYLNHIRKFNY